MQVATSVQFAASVQHALVAGNWDKFEGQVPGLWRAPRMSTTPCVRVAVHFSAVPAVIRSPASGRVFVPGPHVSTAVGVVHAAAPAEVLLTDAALRQWRNESMVRVARAHAAAELPGMRGSVACRLHAWQVHVRAQ
jgi:class 3 adenylate cyclase